MDLRRLLELLAAGKLSVGEAESRLSLTGIDALEDFARLDTGRHARKGVPEVVYAPGKTAEQLVKICAAMVRATGSAIASGLEEGQWQALEKEFPDRITTADPRARIMVIRAPGQERSSDAGTIGIISAGTADIPVAEQAAIMAGEMGCTVLRAYDVGVAGVHRLADPLKQMLSSDTRALVVVAGMEGALPSVVSGLVPVPVIGLPTSTGYGLGGEGITALLAMLQSCSPGLSVVNIDNGIGAGATAALIAKAAGR
ncbi:N5-carboxyaminoimidazole ribonucleotide mutase [bacterium BMS3Abin01]|nr:N5-carboxyaminoimidazole ribonucleotide mutase [bacterium BMS3Abin01]HDY69532.1 nickel pincer cofactor biosynthesis protein LarB [Actinomycetota bacterium]